MVFPTALKKPPSSSLRSTSGGIPPYARCEMVMQVCCDAHDKLCQAICPIQWCITDYLRSPLMDSATCLYYYTGAAVATSFSTIAEAIRLRVMLLSVNLAHTDVSTLSVPSSHLTRLIQPLERWCIGIRPFVTEDRRESETTTKGPTMPSLQLVVIVRPGGQRSHLDPAGPPPSDGGWVLHLSILSPDLCESESAQDA